MSLFASRQLHRLLRMDGKRRAASHEQVYPIAVSSSIAVPSSGSRKDIDSRRLPAGEVYTPNPNKSSGNALGRYWRRVVPSLLLLTFLWGALSASLQQPMSQRLFAATVSASGLLQGGVYNLNFRNPTGDPNLISEINVAQGQYVRQGQILARLDPTYFQRNVDEAQAAVITAERRVDVTLAYHERSIKWLQVLIAEAQTEFHAAQATLRDTNLEAQASIAAAQATLESDQRVLAHVQKQAKTEIQAGKTQLAQSVASCRSSQENGTSTPVSQNGRKTLRAQKDAETQKDSVKTCVREAQAQYRQVAAEAQTSVTTALAQIIKDQAAIVQASASARTAVTDAQGEVAVAQAHIRVATYEPQVLDAAKDVVEAQEVLTLARERLQTVLLYRATGTSLVAPRDGVVTAINGTVGGLPGIPVNVAPQGSESADGDVFIQLVDPSHVDRLRLNVDEKDITKVKVGQRVQFTLKAYADRQFSGTVSAISPNGVAIDSTMVFPVIVRIAPESVKGAALWPNMTATSTIAVG